mmetsp:Transcript_49879/g.139606  ORF Transcript_49879/g.139606 Transcript_49879/m.139606 type:complete len:202 (+) Transcript_49879:389-994(+)
MNSRASSGSFTQHGLPSSNSPNAARRTTSVSRDLVVVWISALWNGLWPVRRRYKTTPTLHMSLRPGRRSAGTAAFSPDASMGGFSSGGAYQSEPAPSAGRLSAGPSIVACGEAHPKSPSFSSTRWSGSDKRYKSMFSGFTSWWSMPHAKMCSKAKSSCRIMRATSSSGNNFPAFRARWWASNTVEPSQYSRIKTSSLAQSS